MGHAPHLRRKLENSSSKGEHRVMERHLPVVQAVMCSGVIAYLGSLSKESKHPCCWGCPASMESQQAVVLRAVCEWRRRQ